MYLQDRSAKTSLRAATQTEAANFLPHHVVGVLGSCRGLDHLGLAKVMGATGIPEMRCNVHTNPAYLHHFQLLWVGQVTRGSSVLQDV